LFDIKNDPYELEDIGSKKEFAAVVDALTRSLFDWMQSVKDPLLEGPLRTPYYDKSMADFRKVAQSEENH
jgi:hypothetical protein